MMIGEAQAFLPSPCVDVAGGSDQKNLDRAEFGDAEGGKLIHTQG